MPARERPDQNGANAPRGMMVLGFGVDLRRRGADDRLFSSLSELPMLSSMSVSRDGLNEILLLCKVLSSKFALRTNGAHSEAIR